jgi:hypothetical protein
MSVQLRAGAVAARAQLNGRHVLKTHQLAVFAGANNDVANSPAWLRRPSR